MTPSGYWVGILNRKMFHANNEKKDNWWNRTTKPRKNENIRRKGNLKILGNNGSEHHQASGDERKFFKKEYIRITKEQHETKLYRRILIKGINTWAELLVRYSGPFLKWKREELQQMEQRNRKFLPMYKALHSRVDINYICQEKEEED